MALYIEIRANDRVIAVYAARNMTAIGDDCDYEVRRYTPGTWQIDEEPIGNVRHRRSEGAEKLAIKILQLV